MKRFKEGDKVRLISSKEEGVVIYSNPAVCVVKFNNTNDDKVVLVRHLEKISNPRTIKIV